MAEPVIPPVVAECEHCGQPLYAAGPVHTSPTGTAHVACAVHQTRKDR